MTNDNPPPTVPDLPPIVLDNETWHDTLEMMIAKLDEVIHDFSLQEGVSILTRSRINRDMQTQRAALARALECAKNARQAN